MKNWLQVGATPRWTFDARMCGLKISAKPSSTSRICVAKSISARPMFTRADSRVPTMFRVTSTAITSPPPTMSQGFSFSGAQKIER